MGEFQPANPNAPPDVKVMSGEELVVWFEVFACEVARRGLREMPDTSREEPSGEPGGSLVEKEWDPTKEREALLRRAEDLMLRQLAGSRKPSTLDPAIVAIARRTARSLEEDRLDELANSHAAAVG